MYLRNPMASYRLALLSSDEARQPNPLIRVGTPNQLVNMEAEKRTKLS